MITKEKLREMGFVRIKSELNGATEQHYFPPPISQNIRIFFSINKPPHKWMAVNCENSELNILTVFDSIDEIRSFVKDF